MVKIISGIGSFGQFTEFKKLYTSKNILLVTGKSSYSACGAESILNRILKDDNVIKFSDFDVNPKIEDAERGAALARNSGIDIIIAVGGGSVIDMAKLIKAFYSAPELSRELVQGSVSMSDPNIPLIVAPTTAGSGSEATHFAVVYIGLEKYSLASPFLLPEIVILDGLLISTCTPYQKACNGLDALSQAIESAWAAGSTNESRAHSFEAVRLCFKYLKKVVENVGGNTALQRMLEASNLAGQAINISKTTAAHAWSYGITSQHNVPHGHAVWLTLPKIFQFHLDATKDKVTDPRGLEHLHIIMNNLKKLSMLQSENATEHFHKYLTSLNVEPEMSNIGANTKKLRKDLSERVNMQRMSNNPICLDSDDIAYIFNL